MLLLLGRGWSLTVATLPMLHRPSADHYASLPPSRASCVSPSGPLRSCVLHDVYFVTGKGFVLLDGTSN